MELCGIVLPVLALLEGSSKALASLRLSRIGAQEALFKLTNFIGGEEVDDTLEWIIKIESV